MSALGSLVLEGLGEANLTSNGTFAVVDANSGGAIVTADTWQSVEYRSEQRVADYPIEQGGFSSYNKVAEPFDLRLVLVCGGGDLTQQLLGSTLESVDAYIDSLTGASFTQPMTRSQFILACESLQSSLQLVDVITPDRTYEQLNCVHFSYSKSREKGAGVVYGELWFREIRISTTATYTSTGNPAVNSNSVDAADSTSIGSVTPVTPNPTNQAVINAASFV